MTARTRAVIIVVGGLIATALLAHAANGQTVKPKSRQSIAKRVVMFVPRAAVVVATNQPSRGLLGSIIYIGGYAVDGVQAVTNALDGGGPVTKKVNPLHYVNVVVNKIDDGFDAAEVFYGGPTP